MSRIDELIRKYAPDGVEYKTLGEVGTFVRGNGLQKKDLVGDGCPCIHYGQIYTYYGTAATATKSFVSGELAARLRKAKTGDLIIATTSENIGDVGKAVVWLGGGELAFGGHTSVYRHTLDPLYVAYFFQSEMFQQQKLKHVSGTKVKELPFAGMAKIRIPVPAIEIQQEVARTLAMMESLEADLKVELGAELELRRQQYVHHRDMLLNTRSEPAEWTTLADVAENLDFQRKPITKAARRAGEIPYYGASGVVDHVRDHIFDGDYLLVSEDGANLLTRSAPIAFSISGRAWVNNHAHVLKFDTYAFRRFVEFYLNSIDLAPYVSSGAQPKLTKASLNRIPIPLRTNDELERIVAILDQFKAMVDDLSSALPAEIEARSMQYAYHRDRLLSFEEAVA